MGSIVSRLLSKTGMERSNRPKDKILQRNSLVVKMESLENKQLLEHFGDVPRFLQEAAAEKIAPNIVPDPESLANLKLELAMISLMSGSILSRLRTL